MCSCPPLSVSLRKCSRSVDTGHQLKNSCCFKNYFKSGIFKVIFKSYLTSCYFRVLSLKYLKIFHGCQHAAQKAKGKAEVRWLSLHRGQSDANVRWAPPRLGSWERWDSGTVSPHILRVPPRVRPPEKRPRAPAVLQSGF